MNRFANQVALITGASQGIGAGIALRLAREGADVIVNYRSHREEAEHVAAQISALGRRALIWQADVANRDAVAAMFVGAIAEFGRLDLVVANAGMSIRELVIEADWDNVRRVIEINLFGVFHTCQFAAQQMVKQTLRGRARGKILIISSVLAEVSPQKSSAYNMAKAGINHFAETLAAELAPYHINVNVINPGWIDTPGERHYATEEEIRAGAARLPWGRLGTVEDVAAAAAFLLSDEADYITGATLRVDGGLVVSL